MKVLIIEDELAASDNLIYHLNAIDTSIEIVHVIDAVADAVEYFDTNPVIDLVFMDIHLADGISFEIFEQTKVNAPVVFTTAYDQYAIKAFKVNSLDYILKPISEEEIAAAIEKFKTTLPTSESAVVNNTQLDAVLALINDNQKKHKKSYLVQKRDELIPIGVENIAFFYIETSIVKMVTFTKKEYVINQKLETIESELNPEDFMRINRQYIVHKKAVDKLKFHFKGKMLLDTMPPSPERIIVSKLKAREVKLWLNS